MLTHRACRSPPWSFGLVWSCSVYPASAGSTDDLPRPRCSRADSGLRTALTSPTVPAVGARGIDDGVDVVDCKCGLVGLPSVFARRIPVAATDRRGVEPSPLAARVTILGPQHRSIHRNGPSSPPARSTQPPSNRHLSRQLEATSAKNAVTAVVLSTAMPHVLPPFHDKRFRLSALLYVARIRPSRSPLAVEEFQLARTPSLRRTVFCFASPTRRAGSINLRYSSTRWWSTGSSNHSALPMTSIAAFFLLEGGNGPPFLGGPPKSRREHG